MDREMSTDQMDDQSPQNPFSELFGGDIWQRRYLLRSMLSDMLDEQEKCELSLDLVADPRGEKGGEIGQLRTRFEQMRSREQATTQYNE